MFSLQVQTLCGKLPRSVFRRGKFLGKAHLFTQKSPVNYETWLEQFGVPQAKAKYRRGWNSPLSWSQKNELTR